MILSHCDSSPAELNDGTKFEFILNYGKKSVNGIETCRFFRSRD